MREYYMGKFSTNKNWYNDVILTITVDSGWKAVFRQRTKQILVFWTTEVQETGNDESWVSAFRLVIVAYLFRSVIYVLKLSILDFYF